MPVPWEPSRSIRTEGRKDGRTDMVEIIAAFGNFAKATNNASQYSGNTNTPGLKQLKNKFKKLK